MIVLLLWMLGLIGLVAAFTTGFWWMVLFWIEMQFMYLDAEDYDATK